MALNHALMADSKDDASSVSVTCDAFDSSAYDFLAVFCKHEGTPVAITVTDNKGSGTLTPATKESHSNGDLSAQWHYGPIGTPGAGHTVTMTVASARPFKNICVFAINSNTGATISLDTEDQNQGSSAAHDAGSLVTSAATISLMGVGGYAAQTWTPGSGWTENSEFGFCYKESRSDASAGTLDPAATSDTSADWVAVAVAFKEGASSTLTQSAFRLRNEDGSESTATWPYPENTNGSRPLDTPFRLRTQIDVSGDPGAKQIRREWKLSTDSVWAAVKAAYVAPSVTWGAAGTAASGTTSCTPSYPAGISASTSKLYCAVTGRSNTANTAPTMPAGWTNIGDLEGGTGTFGVDTGTRRVTYFRKDTVTGAESGTVTVSLAGNTNNTLRATIFRVEVPADFTISEAVSTGADTANDTSFSVTGGTSLSWAADDLLLILVAQNIDTGTQSSQAISATGATFGTRTNRASDAVTNGNDHRHILDSVPVSSGSGSSAPTYSYTISAAGSGPCAFLRLRAVKPSQPVALALSSNIAASAATSTTPQLTPPAGKTTADHQAARISDDTNPLPSIDPAANSYLEPEFCTVFQSAGGAVNGQKYHFRDTDNGTPFNSYSQTIEITVGAPPASAAPLNPCARRRRRLFF